MRLPFSCSVLLLLLLLRPDPGRALEPLRFGMLGNTPAWTGMSPQMFDAERALGVGDARLDVTWSELQRSAGPIDFRISDNRFNAVVGDGSKRPMRPLPTIYVGRGWMTCEQPCEQLFADGLCERQATRCRSGCECCQRCPNDESVSRLPLDLTAEPDGEFAYSRTYYDFIRAFIDRYGERLDHVVIENDTGSSRFWDTQTDPDQLLYLRLLATAYKAVKDTRPDIQVTDSGYDSTRLGICIARHQLEVEQRPALAVFEFLREYTRPLRNAIDPPGPLPPLASVDDLGSFLAASPDCVALQNRLAGAELDVWNFHYAESERTVQAVPEYFAYYDALHGRSPRPLLTNQLTCRPQAGGSARDEARCLFKNLIATQALGVRLAAWFGVYGETGVVPWDAAGDDRAAAATYRLLATRLAGKMAAAEPPRRGPEVFRADFVDSLSGHANVVALWSWDDLPHRVELSPPFSGARARIFDYLAAARAVIEPDVALELNVTADPTLVIWEMVPIPCIGDCNADGAVTIDEIITGVGIASGLTGADACPPFDYDGGGSVTIDELVRSVAAALDGCAAPIP